ncbi:MAG TPA: DUF3459 domain-containing protein, partial [Thermomicrobiales bacterium]|nr:DUF3459 domain-containing protein [Thermomicrobiales bacterium]
GDREIFVVAEDGRHEITRARAIDEGGEGLDAIWADDFHHDVRVHLTNAHENYYQYYKGSTTDIATAINKGFGPLTISKKDVAPVSHEDPASAFVFCIQNHDQVGNRPFGDRLHHDINADRYAVASTLMLFAPETPMLFMGQEFSVSTPFYYFTDHPEELGKLVTEGRRQEFSGFSIFDDPALTQSIPDPQAESTFYGSKLKLEERQRNAGIYALYRTLLALRHDDDVLKHNDRQKSHASAISAEMVAVHRWWGTEQRLLLANFGPEVRLTVKDVEAFSPMFSRPWNLMLTTTDAQFGGSGEVPAITGLLGERCVTVPARSALIFAVGD